MKKGLIVFVVLAMAMPAIAGDIKIHGNWPCQYVPQQVAVINATLDVGYYIHILDQDPFPVTQDTSSKDPYHTYIGCLTSDVDTNFEATLSASVVAVSAAGGSWSVTSITVNGGGPVVVPGGANSLEVCIKGNNVKIENLVGGSKDVVIAQVTIKAVPTAACAACAD